MSTTTEFKITKTEIPGLLQIDITLVEDERGFFQEKYQREKLIAKGFPESFVPVQQNISFNKATGTIRGIHAEPWDKYVSVLNGKVYSVFVDLRNGENFGKKFEVEMTSTKAFFVPRGVGNSYQTLTDNVYYLYFVNEHYRPGVQNVGVSVADETLDINWPLGLEVAKLSERDKGMPKLIDISQNDQTEA